MQEIDFRWVADHDPSLGADPYRCRIKSPNTLEFTMPGPSYSLIKDRANFENRMDVCVLDGLDDDAHKLAEDASATGSNKRKVKKVLLVFPDWVVLSAKEIFAHTESEDKNDIFPSSFVNKFRDKNGKAGIKQFLYWKVARKDVRAYKKGRVEQKQLVSRLQQSFAGGGSTTSPPPPRRANRPNPQTGGQQQQQMGGQQQQMGGGLYASSVPSNGQGLQQPTNFSSGQHQDPSLFGPGDPSFFGPTPGPQSMYDDEEDPFGDMGLEEDE